MVNVDKLLQVATLLLFISDYIDPCTRTYVLRITNNKPHVVGAQLCRLFTVDAHTDVLKPIHGKII